MDTAVFDVFKAIGVINVIEVIDIIEIILPKGIRRKGPVKWLSYKDGKNMADNGAKPV